MEDAVDMVAVSSHIEVMKAVGIKTLKNRLSEYVRMSESGRSMPCISPP